MNNYAEEMYKQVRPRSDLGRTAYLLIRHKMRQLSQKPPVLIGGCGRSGTTLLLSILGAFDSIYSIPHESRLYSRWEKAADGRMLPQNWARFIWYLLIYPVPETAQRYCEKTPKNILYIDYIMKYLGEETRFIQLIRDGRDVCTSRHPRDPEAYWVSVRRWVKDVKAGLPHRKHPSVYTLRYEDLVADTERYIRELADFLGENLTERVLNWHESTNVRTSGAWHGGLEKSHTRSIRKWEKPEHAQRLKEFMADGEAVELMQELGYL